MVNDQMDLFADIEVDQDGRRCETGARGVHGQGGSHEGEDGVERGHQEVPAGRLGFENEHFMSNFIFIFFQLRFWTDYNLTVLYSSLTAAIMVS